MKRFSKKLTSDKGFTIVELGASIVIMSIIVLGMTTVLLALAKQNARDKLLNDMNTYGQMMLSEATQSFSNSREFQYGLSANGWAEEDLGFQLTGSMNSAQKYRTRFLNEDHSVRVTVNNSETEFSHRWPPAELDPDRHGTSDLDYEILVKSFRFRRYIRGTTVPEDIRSTLIEATLTLELIDHKADYKIERKYNRVIMVPNRYLQTRREQAAFSSGIG
jgi:type II secretory pathway pseudopilin PulG